MARRRHAVFLFVLAPLWIAAAGGETGQAPSEPRQLSAAERAAVELAAAYLQRGPQAWWERLAAGAPLRRLGLDAALDEIAVRVGPAEGATWQLLTPGPSFDRQTAVFGLEFASGLDETLVLRLVDEGGWRIAGIRASVDPVEIESAGLRQAGLPRRREAGPAVALLACGLPGIFGMVLLAAGRRRLLGIGVSAAAVVAAAGVWVWSQGSATPPPAPRAKAPAADPGLARLGSLRPLRSALAAGTDRAEIQRLLASPPADPGLREIQELWRAHSLLLEADLTAAGAILDRYPTPAKYPLAELLRARVSFRRLRQEETGWAYDQAIRRGLDHDALRLESALAKALTNEGEFAEGDIARLVEMGSRLGEPWYVAAQLAAVKEQMAAAAGFLLHAWQLAPVPRGDLFDDPVLAFLVARPNLFSRFQLGVPEEPRPLPQGDPKPLDVPAEAGAASCGQALRLTLGGAELLVPGGADLAPIGTVLEDAATWSWHAEEKALAALPSLVAEAAAGKTLQPRSLRIADQAARALAEQNRWRELIELTEPLVADVERVPASLVRRRALALRRVGRLDAARQLLIRLAGTDFASRRPTPATLLDLSELFAANGEYDTAIKLSLKADSQLPAPRGERRRKQLAMDRDLAASYASYRSEHFDVRYPQATGETYARGVALVLEEERRRLQRWIPQTGGEPIEVHLFPLKDFLANYSGDIGVIGLFDGKVRVPFAELRSLHPRLVAILSHEVAHAMVAAASADQAPHWLQEGLAEHVEMGEGRVNPLPDLARTGRALSFPVLDPILRGFAEEQLVDLAYSEAAWTVHFIEARFGVQAIHRLLAAYAAGRTTETALQEVCGLSLAEFDRALWQWGTSQAPPKRALAVRRYDREYATLLRREQQQSVRSILRVGMSEEARTDLARRQEQEAERRRRMAAWHAAYAARAAGVKLALKPILQRSKGVRVDIVPACTELSAGVTRMLDDPALWTSPDAEVNRALRDAYRLLGKLGNACLSGRDNEIGFLIVEVDRALNEAARVLAPYELKP